MVRLFAHMLNVLIFLHSTMIFYHEFFLTLHVFRMYTYLDFLLIFHYKNYICPCNIFKTHLSKLFQNESLPFSIL